MQLVIQRETHEAALKRWCIAHKVWVLPFCCAVLLAACGGGANSDSSSSENSGTQSKSGASAKRNKVDACSLLTKAEAEQALGEAASDGGTNEKDLGQTGGVLTVCSYSAAKRPAKHTNVSIWQANPDSSAQWNARTMWGNLKSGNKSLSDQRQGGKFEPVTGVGDESYVFSWPAGSIGFTELHVLKGDVIVGVRVPGQAVQAVERAKGLALKALERAKG